MKCLPSLEHAKQSDLLYETTCKRILFENLNISIYC